ncbi:hypothetical protein BH23ACT10_BH23ACT10_33500 [soil metagenome]
MDQFIDAYAVLGVDPAADQATIKATYRRLAAAHHPDVVPEGHRQAATARMQRINVAYGLIRQPDARRRYDQVRNLHRARGSLGDVEDVWSQLLWTAGRWVGQQRNDPRGPLYRVGFTVGRWLRG